MRVWWFSTKGSPNQEMMQVCFPHYFSYVLLFFSASFPPQKKGKDEYETCISLATAGFRCCFLFFCFLKRPWPHSKINWLSSWSNWKSIRRFSASWCVPKPMKSGSLRDFGRKTPALEVTRRCQDVPSPVFFFRGFQGKFHGFNSTRHMLKRLKKKVVLPLLAGWFEEVFGWMPFSWRLTWRKNCETWGCHG